ncbi:MAG: SDR family NAD(P)-dependent oxidoreductase [Gaiella sp.]
MSGNQIAVVTGASSGIGEAAARALTARGWHCVLVARREDRLRALAGELGGEVEVCDVADREAVNALAARVLERHPQVRLLLNNAGIPARGSFLTVEDERIEQVLGVNYLGGVWCARAFLPGLRAAAVTGRAHVVNLVSVAGAVAFAPAGAYAASKHAQLAFSRSLAAALRGSGISVHAVLPGFVETEGFPQKGVLASRLLSRFVIDTSRVAESIVKAIEKNRAEVVVPWFPYRQIMLLQALFPALLARFAGASDYKR